MKKQMTPLERCPRCGAVRAPGQVAVSLPRGQEPPAPSQDGPSAQRGGHV